MRMLESALGSTDIYTPSARLYLYNAMCKIPPSERLYSTRDLIANASRRHGVETRSYVHALQFLEEQLGSVGNVKL